MAAWGCACLDGGGGFYIKDRVMLKTDLTQKIHSIGFAAFVCVFGCFVLAAHSASFGRAAYSTGLRTTLSPRRWCAPSALCTCSFANANVVIRRGSFGCSRRGCRRTCARYPSGSPITAAATPLPLKRPVRPLVSFFVLFCSLLHPGADVARAGAVPAQNVAARQRLSPRDGRWCADAVRREHSCEAGQCQ